MTQRVEGGVTWTQTFNAENRLASVSNGTDTWSFTYDGDGNRIKQVNPDGKITLFLGGGIYTVEDAAGTPDVTRYYSIAGQRVAMNGAEGLQYLLTDHLGSVSAVLDDDGVLVSEQRYLPFGGVRPVDTGITQTDFAFTGQHNLAAVGLMDYNARWYGQTVGAFTQPDSLVTDPVNPQNLNRYSYVYSNPVNILDPSGHDAWWCTTANCQAQYNASMPNVVENKLRFCQIRPDRCNSDQDPINLDKDNDETDDFRGAAGEFADFLAWQLYPSAQGVQLGAQFQFGLSIEKTLGAELALFYIWRSRELVLYLSVQETNYFGTPSVVGGGVYAGGTDVYGLSRSENYTGPYVVGGLQGAIDAFGKLGVSTQHGFAKTSVEDYTEIYTAPVYIDPGSQRAVSFSQSNVTIGGNIAGNGIDAGGYYGTGKTWRLFSLVLPFMP